MNLLKVAVLQILPENTMAKNLKKGLWACKKAKDAGADIALFPEMWSNGYTIPQKTEALKAQAVTADSAFITAFKNCAKELKMAIAVTFLESYEPTPRNSIILFDRHGKNRLLYAKVHTCDFGEERILTAGKDFYTTELDTDKGMVKVGTMICYDREFPESARILMLKGAEIVLVPNACPMEINRLSQLRGRAFENMMGIVTCNYPTGHPDCNGHSSAFDGIAYLPGIVGSRDTCILESGSGESIDLAVFDMDILRQYRQNEVHGNTYRHPQKYQMLMKEEIKEPFIRKDYRK